MNEQESAKSDEQPARPPLWKRPRVIVTAGVVVVVAVIAGTLWWLHKRKFENTDDAFVDAHVVRLSPKTSGQITAIFVHDNEFVHAGAVIAEIDPADSKAKLEQAQAQIAAAEAMRQQAAASLEAAKAQAERSDSDLKRVRALKRSTPEAVAQGQLDQAEAAARSADAQREAAERQLRAAGAQVEAANAQVDQAQLTLSYTQIVAPIDGHIAQRSIAVGSYVAPGQQILALIPRDLWVTANFKETQLAMMRVGQRVDVDVDACPHIDVHGHVDSIQRGAGQAFAILPPENATGNYVKVVQRVPVKIVLDHVPDSCLLGPGMSVVPSVRIR